MYTNNFRQFAAMINYLVVRLGITVVHYTDASQTKNGCINVVTKEMRINMGNVKMQDGVQRYLTIAHELGHYCHYVVMGEDFDLFHNCYSVQYRELVADMFANWLASQYGVELSQWRVYHYTHTVGANFDAEEIRDAEDDFHAIVDAFTK